MNQIDIELREQIIKHLTQWFRALGLETHQIDNSANELLNIFNTNTLAILERLKEQKQWRGVAEEIVLMTAVQAEIDKLTDVNDMDGVDDRRDDSGMKESNDK